MRKKDTYLSLRLESELKRRLEKEAKEQRRSLNWLVGEYIIQGLKRDEKRVREQG